MPPSPTSKGRHFPFGFVQTQFFSFVKNVSFPFLVPNIDLFRIARSFFLSVSCNPSQPSPQIILLNWNNGEGPLKSAPRQAWANDAPPSPRQQLQMPGFPQWKGNWVVGYVKAFAESRVSLGVKVGGRFPCCLLLTAPSCLWEESNQCLHIVGCEGGLCPFALHCDHS